MVGFQPWVLVVPPPPVPPPPVPPPVPLPPVPLPPVAAEAVVHPTTGNATATSPLSGAVVADVDEGVVEAEGVGVVDVAPRRELPQPVRAAPATTSTPNPPSLDSAAPNPYRRDRPARCSVVTDPDDKPLRGRTAASARSRSAAPGADREERPPMARGGQIEARVNIS